MGLFLPGPSPRFFLGSWLLQEAVFGGVILVFFPSTELLGCQCSLVLLMSLCLEPLPFSRLWRSVPWSFPMQLKPSSDTTVVSPAETSLTTEEETRKSNTTPRIPRNFIQEVVGSWAHLQPINIMYWGPRRCLSLRG